MIDCGTSSRRPVMVLGIGGSRRAGSQSLAALQAAMAAAVARGADTVLADLHRLHLPLLDQDRTLETYPEDVAWLLDAVCDADGIILCSPTYHGSIAGVFKNALDLLVYGNEEHFLCKPVGVMALGGANGAPVLEMMTTTVYALSGLVVPTRVLVPHGLVGETGTIEDPDVAARVDRMATQVVEGASALRRPSRRDHMVTPGTAFATGGGA